MNARAISTLLDDHFCQPLPEEAQAENLSIAAMLERLHERSFGLIIILLGLPIAIPGCPPPIPSIFALPLCVLCFQMMLGYSAPVLPGFIARRNVNQASLQRTIKRSLPYIRTAEKLIAPRLAVLTGRRSERVMGLIMLLFSMTILIPLPLTNTVPGISVIIMSAGLLSRDGLLVIAGTILGAAWITLLLWGGQELITRIF